MILLAILGRFVLVVDSMYRSHIRKILVVYKLSETSVLLLSDKERPTYEFEQALNNFAVYLI